MLNLGELDFFMEGMFSVRMKLNWKRLRTHATACFTPASYEQNNLKRTQMKRLLLLLSIIGLVLTSCEDKRLQTYMANVPVYMSYDELRSSFELLSGVALEKPGKISFYGSHMFINEYQKGIHVVDLSDPTQPELKTFIEVPGNVDMAIRNDLLYAESFVEIGRASCRERV